jgi:formamidopyrimidine-DNA glycosylase
MPERPDLEYVVPILAKELTGRTITGVRVKKPVVLRLAVPGQPGDLLNGQTVRGVTRRAHFVLFALEGPGDLELAVAPMLAGLFAVKPADERSPAALALALSLSDGRELRYLDDVQMGKVYVLPRGQYGLAPGLEKIGVDVLGRGFTKEAFRRLARARRDQAKVFLLDKSALDAMGNAYADEVLWEARLHPKAMVRSLSDEQVDALHDAIVKVLGEARDTIAKRRPPTDEKLRDFLKVRGRVGQPCPRCGTTLRSAGVHGHDAEFCPECQPDSRGTSLVDWRKVPKPGAPRG